MENYARTIIVVNLSNVTDHSTHKCSVKSEKNIILKVIK